MMLRNLKQSGAIAFSLLLALYLGISGVLAQTAQISPTTMTTNAAQTLTLSGVTLQAGMTLEVVGVGTYPINDTDGTINLPAGLAAGVYDLILHDGGASTPLADKLTITAPPPRIEPKEILNTAETSLLVFGDSLQNDMRVQLVGFGLLNTTESGGVLSATIPAGLPAREYTVQIIAGNGNVITVPDKLKVNAPPPDPIPPTAAPLPTEIPPTIQPTIVPGQPYLITRGFSANPASIPPGGTTTLTFEVINQGNRPALNGAITLDASSGFSPANGQAAIPLPDLAVGAVYTVSLSVVASMDAKEGMTNIPLNFTYRDFDGQSQNNTVNLSVHIQAVTKASQLLLSRYMLYPNEATPGEPITVTVLVSNMGNEVASQALLRFSGENGVLLAGAHGDSFPLGDIPALGSISLELPMIVNREAKEGPQSQSFSLSYLQKGEKQESSGTITIPVQEIIKPEAVLLLDSYDVGADILKPGDKFTLTMGLKNVGDADAANMLVTFGTVEATGGGGTGGGTDNDNNTGGNTGGTTSTTPSSTFAPLGAGGTLFIGTVKAGDDPHEITQEFIVNGSVTSGIYSLPINLRFQTPDGTNQQVNLRASVVVLSPPKLRTTLMGEIPPEVNIGEPFSIALQVQNIGTAKITLDNSTVTAENGEVLDGADAPLEPLGTDEDVTVNAMVMPLEEGDVEVTLQIHYQNDLNQPDSLTFTYHTVAVEPPPPPPEPPFIETPEPPPVVEEKADDFIGRLLLGLLGLGS